MSRRSTYSPSGMVSTHSPKTEDGDVETEAGEATVEDLIGQMSHRQAE